MDYIWVDGEGLKLGNRGVYHWSDAIVEVTDTEPGAVLCAAIGCMSTRVNPLDTSRTYGLAATTRAASPPTKHRGNFEMEFESLL